MKIKIVKSTFGGVKYVAVPKVLRPGGVGSWGDLVLEFELPEGWDKYAVTLHTQQEGASDAGVPILLEDGKATVDSRITAARRGLWMLMATDGETVTAMTEPGSWECYDTVDLDGTTEALDKTVYEQFVAKVMAIADNAQDAADSAKWSETIAVNFASEAESWAVGGTGRRTGEDTDNAKYYAEQAEATLELITDASAYAVEAKEAAAQAKTYATDAKTSEANAKGSETAAGSSAAAAAKSATAAEASNQAAQDAAENASTSETNAKASQTAAASSASTASSKASAASTSATKAANSATAAATSATNAASSATAAAASAKEAAASASDFTGASSSTAGVHGLVPAPEAGKQESYLRGDGTWAEVQEYTLPEATADTLGGVKVGDNITVSGGTISVTADNIAGALGFTPQEGTTFTTISLPTQSGGLTYTGSAQSPTWSGYDSSKMAIVDGTTSATNAGTYYVSFAPKVGYCWSDGTMLTKTASWIIGASGSLTVPSQSGTLTYNISAQSPTWSNYDSTKLTIGGTTSSTNAGTYTATFTPKTNYAWYDGTTGTKSVTWTIGKAANKIVFTSDYWNDGSYEIKVTSYSNGVLTLAGDYIYSSWFSGDSHTSGSGANYKNQTVTWNSWRWQGTVGNYTLTDSGTGSYSSDSVNVAVTVAETDNYYAASTTGKLEYYNENA